MVVLLEKVLKDNEEERGAKMCHQREIKKDGWTFFP